MDIFVGLVKFFSRKDYLDSLLDGYFHMTPPEKYRLDGREGVGDRVESCVASYRSSRNDELPLLIFNGRAITDILDLTLHNGSTQDSWLNCWLKLSIPSEKDELQELISVINQMKAEFGRDYAFIYKDNIPELFKRLNTSSNYPIYGGSVHYSDNREEWGTLCKSLNYAYQREYRFYAGQCNPHDLVEYGFHVEGGFRDIILDNVSLALKNADEIIFSLERT